MVSSCYKKLHPSPRSTLMPFQMLYLLITSLLVSIFFDRLDTTDAMKIINKEGILNRRLLLNAER
jgi:hypothetical protein